MYMQGKGSKKMAIQIEGVSEDIVSKVNICMTYYILLHTNIIILTLYKIHFL